MTKKDFLLTMAEVFRNLEEYYPELKDRRVKRYFLKKIEIPKFRMDRYGLVSQKIYELLRDRVEKEIRKMEGPREWIPGIKKNLK